LSSTSAANVRRMDCKHKKRPRPKNRAAALAAIQMGQ
jgi:hypothetical protein